MKPPVLRPGDTVAIIAPASAPRDRSVYYAGVKKLESFGYVVLPPRILPENGGYLAGSDDERLTELNYLISRTDVKALFCARGGYGVTRILDRLDYEAARHNPKIIVGYSDITALHAALLEKAGWTSISGPLVVEFPELGSASVDSLFDLIAGKIPDELVGPAGERLVGKRNGIAEGVLFGGNLTLIAQLAGTPYFPSAEKLILFLEDVGEPAYRIDRHLSSLRLTGVLDRISGLVLGHFTDAGDPKPGDMTITEVMDDYFGAAGFPVATGLCYGHFPDKVSIPIGVRARLSVSDETAKLVPLESVTEA